MPGRPVPGPSEPVVSGAKAGRRTLCGQKYIEIGVGRGDVDLLVSHRLGAHLTLQAGNYLRTSLVFCGIISIGTMAPLLAACLRLLLRWADPSRR